MEGESGESVGAQVQGEKRPKRRIEVILIVAGAWILWARMFYGWFVEDRREELMDLAHEGAISPLTLDIALAVGTTALILGLLLSYRWSRTPRTPR